MLYPNLTIEAIIAEVRKVAAERPDFVYAEQPERVALVKRLNILNGALDCSYVGAYEGSVDTDQAGEGCIVGQALKRLGVSSYQLRNVEGRSASSAIGYLTGSTKGTGWLNLVQSGQDGGLSWSEAIANAGDPVAVKVGA